MSNQTPSRRTVHTARPSSDYCLSPRRLHDLGRFDVQIHQTRRPHSHRPHFGTRMDTQRQIPGEWEHTRLRGVHRQRADAHWTAPRWRRKSAHHRHHVWTWRCCCCCCCYCYCYCYCYSHSVISNTLLFVSNISFHFTSLLFVVVYEHKG